MNLKQTFLSILVLTLSFLGTSVEATSYSRNNPSLANSIADPIYISFYTEDGFYNFCSNFVLDLKLDEYAPEEIRGRNYRIIPRLDFIAGVRTFNRHGENYKKIAKKLLAVAFKNTDRLTNVYGESSDYFYLPDNTFRDSNITVGLKFKVDRMLFTVESYFNIYI